MKTVVVAVVTVSTLALVLPPPLYGQGSITVVDLGLGCEPSLEADSNGNLAVLWIDQSARMDSFQQLWRRTSSNSGTSWTAASAIPEWTRAGEPTMALNATLLHFYYGWLSRDNNAGTHGHVFMASSRDNPLAPIPVDENPAHWNDRPWLIARHPYAYAAMYRDVFQRDEIHFKRSNVIDGEGAISWPTATQKVAFTTDGNTGKYDVYSQRLAKGRSSGGNDYLYLMALRIHVQSDWSDNSLKVFRSSNNGDTWDAGSDGWSGGAQITNFPDPNPSDPDIFGLNISTAKGMFAYHTLADPGGSNVYVLYTQMGLRSADGDFVTKFFCRRSRDDGATWDDHVQIIPETTYATFPKRVNPGADRRTTATYPTPAAMHISRDTTASDGCGARLEVENCTWCGWTTALASRPI